MHASPGSGLPLAQDSKIQTLLIFNRQRQKHFLRELSQIRQHLGIETISNSYIHFLIMKATGLNFSEMLVDAVTLVVFFASAVISIRPNILMTIEK